jgi:hypothetical protein
MPDSAKGDLLRKAATLPAGRERVEFQHKEQHMNELYSLLILVAVGVVLFGIVLPKLGIKGG